MKNIGFTLIELLVTMGIIAVLTGMAAFNFNQSRMRARDVQRKSDLGQLVKAMELYKIDNGAYPDPADTADGNFQTLLYNQDYIKITSFVDPKGSEWANTASSQSTYKYAPVANASGNMMSYSMMTCLENKADSTRAEASQCLLFPNGAGLDDNVVCKCGGTDISNYSGSMYIVTNP